MNRGRIHIFKIIETLTKIVEDPELSFLKILSKTQKQQQPKQLAQKREGPPEPVQALPISDRRCRS